MTIDDLFKVIFGQQKTWSFWTNSSKVSIWFDQIWFYLIHFNSAISDYIKSKSNYNSGGFNFTEARKGHHGSCKIIN